MTFHVVLIIITASMVMVSTIGSGSAITYSITKTKSGLLTSDSMTTGNSTLWTFGGTASSYNDYEDSQGLHIGVKSPQSGNWVNYYAVTSQSNAELFHATETIPYSSVSDGVFNIGLYVEGSDYIPHVGCEAYADSTGYYWIVEQSKNAGQTYTILYSSPVSSEPHTQDCTIVTNGNNSLNAYIGGKLVFSSTSMSLGMSAPFHVYFQDDTSSSNSMHYATYSDYYATTSQNIQVTNNPSNAVTVELVDSSGQVLASSPVSGGIATLNVGKYAFPLQSSIEILDSSNSMITSSHETVYGGDVFSVTTSTTVPGSPTNLAATAGNAQVSLSWTAPSNNGGSAITNYKIYRSTSSGTETLLATVGNVSSYTDTGLTNGQAYFYKVTAVNSVGESAQSNEAGATPAAPSSNGIALGNVQSTSGTVSIPPYQITLSNFNAGTASNQLLVVGISANNNPATSVTFGGTQLTQAAASFFNNDAEFWYLKNPTGTANIVVTMSGATSAVVGAYAFSGVDLANPVPTVSTNHNTAASSPSISITTKNPNSWVLDLPSIWGGVTLSSPTCAQQWDVNVQGAITGASSSAVVPSAGSATCKWTASSADSWDDAALEVKASGTGTISTVPGSPTGLTATSGNAQVSLSWTAPGNNGGSAITGYNVYRGTASGAEGSAPIATGIASTTYTDTRLTNGQAYFYKVTAVNSVGESAQSNEASATPAIATHSVVQVSSGLVIVDPLNNETKTKQQLESNPRYWYYYGDAVGENASYALFKNFTGLYIGAQAAPNQATKSGPPMNGEWAGFYAESPNTNDMLFHSIVSTPVRSIPTKDTWYENGIYVQTTQPLINYVTCTSLTGWYAPGLTWGIGGAQGDANQALTFQTYYENYSQNQPLTVDCTIITNGTNFLKAYINGAMVYESKTLNLNMPPPFNSYLEPQSDYAGQLLNGTFTDYYVTTNENVTVNNLPGNAVRVDMTDGSGKVVASAPASSSTAVLDIGKYRFPLSASIQVYDSTNTPIASTPGTAKIYGGDVYAFR